MSSFCYRLLCAIFQIHDSSIVGETNRIPCMVWYNVVQHVRVLLAYEMEAAMCLCASESVHK